MKIAANFLEKAKELSLNHLQKFLEGIRTDVVSNIPKNDPKLTKMFMDIENKIYDIMKKIHDTNLMTQVEAEANKTSRLARLKKALDAVNEELAKPTYEPRKDFDREDSPFFSRGIETNKVAPDDPLKMSSTRSTFGDFVFTNKEDIDKASEIRNARSREVWNQAKKNDETNDRAHAKVNSFRKTELSKLGAFEQMPKKFSGSVAELCQLAIDNGYARVIGTPSKLDFRKRVEDESGYDYEIEYQRSGKDWLMFGGEVRVRYEMAPDISLYMKKLKKSSNANSSYYIEVGNELSKLLNKDIRLIDIRNKKDGVDIIYSNNLEIEQSWRYDGSVNKPVTMLHYDEDDIRLGRFSIWWNNPKMYAEDIVSVLNRSGKQADIKQHRAPTKLPPREDVRSHMDQDVKNEIKKDPDLKKEGSRYVTKKKAKKSRYIG